MHVIRESVVLCALKKKKIKIMKKYLITSYKYVHIYEYNTCFYIRLYNTVGAFKHISRIVKKKKKTNDIIK